MSESTNKKRFLVIGMTGAKDVPAERVYRAMAQEVAKAKAMGFELEDFLFKPLGAKGWKADYVTSQEEFDAQWDVFRSILKDQHWDGFAVGYGVRGNVDLTDLYEKIVNMCIEETGGATKFSFQVLPEAIVDGIVRVHGRP